MVSDDTLSEGEGSQSGGRMSWMIETYREFEWQDLEFIQELHIDSGILRGLVERFPGDSHIRQWVDYFLRVNEAEIENLMEDVLYDRRTIAELEGLQRG